MNVNVNFNRIFFFKLEALEEHSSSKYLYFKLQALQITSKLSSYVNKLLVTSHVYNSQTFQYVKKI